jgi:Ca2+-binding RTX toxin-like protein
VLSGGAGRDTFVFSSKLGASNVDRIADFNVASDSIYLDDAIFTALHKGASASRAPLKAGFFTIGSAAKDASDHIIYDSRNGILSYDADGSGGGNAVDFATIGKNLKLTEADFFIV